MTNEWKRYLIMNTKTAPVPAQCILEKQISKRPLIDINAILAEPEETYPSFEEIMKEAKVNE